MIACICGLTVIGTGTDLAGTSRRGGGVCAFAPAGAKAAAAAKPNAMVLHIFMACIPLLR